MKKILAAALACAVLFGSMAFAEEKSNPIKYNLGVDFAFYPKAEKVGTGTDENVLRFAPTTGIYNNLEGRINLSGTYKIATPLGKNALLSGANIEIKENLEITPVSFAPSTAISFTPVPFLVFNAGFKVGTGWTFIGIPGMSKYDPTLENTNNYSDLPAFGNLFAKYWAQATFQFDTGAIVEGDWTHIQTMYTYQVYYEGITGMADQQLWCWQGTTNKVNGVKEYMNAILAYQMPMVLSRVGFIFESDRYYNPNVYALEAYNGAFREMNLSAMGQLSFTKKDTLTILLNFANRRTFAGTYNADLPESMQACTGEEWYFKRFALSYSHDF